MRPAELLDGPVGAPGQLQGHVNPPLPVLNPPVRLQRDTAARRLGDDRHEFLALHEAVLLGAVEHLEGHGLVRAAALVTELAGLVVHHDPGHEGEQWQEKERERYEKEV